MLFHASIKASKRVHRSGVHSLFLSGTIMFLPDKFSYIFSKKLFLSYWTGVKIADFYVSLSKHNKCCIMEYLSKERYDQIVEELNNLINVEYPKIKEDLSEARAQGDLSENFEYRAARRAQAKTISRIRFLQKVLEYSRVLDTAALPKDQVSLLSKVEFTNLSSNVRMTYTIVSPHEMDIEKGKISCKSPIGAALMGKKVGDVVDVLAPSGTFRIKIENLSVGQ